MLRVSQCECGIRIHRRLTFTSTHVPRHFASIYIPWPAVLVISAAPISHSKFVDIRSVFETGVDILNKVAMVNTRNIYHCDECVVRDPKRL